MCVFYFKDSIEANVESAEVHVQQANQQLSRAANYQVTVIHCLITWSFDLKYNHFEVAAYADIRVM